MPLGLILDGLDQSAIDALNTPWPDVRELEYEGVLEPYHGPANPRGAPDVLFTDIPRLHHDQQIAALERAYRLLDALRWPSFGHGSKAAAQGTTAGDQ